MTSTRLVLVGSLVFAAACGSAPPSTDASTDASDAAACVPALPDVVVCRLPSGRPCGPAGCYADDGVNYCECDDGGGVSCTLIGVIAAESPPRCLEPTGSCTRVTESYPLGTGCARMGAPGGSLVYCPDPGDACPATNCFLSHRATDTCGTFWCCY